MEWIKRLNDAIKYIETHLTEDVSYDELGRIACCSSYHFQRMFTYMAGISLSEYIRRRKMSLAASDLINGGEKVIDVAMKYGYSSPTAFNRAFQNIHGVAPSALKNEGVSIKSYPQLVFALTVKGAEEMNYRIETKEAFRIIGISQPLEREIEKNHVIVPQMWQKASMDGTIQKIASKMSGEPYGLLGVCSCHDEDWKYFIAVANKDDNSEYEEYIVPQATWAIFTGTGTNISIQQLQQRIVTEWLPTSGYEYANAPDIEVYLNPDPDNAKYEVWIPVIKK